MLLNNGISIPTSSVRYNNYYNVLRLKRNCSAKEIKAAFIKLSKQYHPDINKDKEAHKKFLAINDAYKTLSNQDSRRSYDLRCGNKTYAPHFHYAADPWKDPSFYHNRDKTQDCYHAQKPYYGITGLKKVSNFTIVLLCIGVMIIGVSLQVILIQKSLAFKRHELLRRSQEAQETLDRIRHTALTTTKKEQLELLKLRLGQKD